MTHHARFEPAQAAPALLIPGSGGIESGQHPMLAIPAEPRSADELSIAYAQLARRFPDETFSRDLILGGAAAGKLRAVLFVTVVAILVTIIARGIGAWA